MQQEARMAGTPNRRRRNPTQADIIHTMLVQEVAKTQQELQAAIVRQPRDAEDVARYKGQRDALTAFENRVKRYLDGDTSALYA
jgi:hypothetical protein